MLAGGIIGLGVDAGTGANLDLRPNPLVAELHPIDSDMESRIVLSKEDLERMKKEDEAAGKKTDTDEMSTDEAPIVDAEMPAVDAMAVDGADDEMSSDEVMGVDDTPDPSTNE